MAPNLYDTNDPTPAAMTVREFNARYGEGEWYEVRRLNNITGHDITELTGACVFFDVDCSSMILAAARASF